MNLVIDNRGVCSNNLLNAKETMPTHQGKGVIMIYLKRATRGCIGPCSYLTFFGLLSLFLFFLSTPVHSGTIELPQTGQTSCYNKAGTIIPCTGTGHDGDFLAGVPWPTPRFTTDISLQCITDNLTGLTWASNPGGLSASAWAQAIVNLRTTFFGCGLSDWRIPNINELQSLINAEQPDNALWLTTQGFTFPFIDVLPYWTSTSSADNPTVNAWVVDMVGGSVFPDNKGFTYFIWPVRGTSNPSPPADIPPGQIAETGQITIYATYDDAYFATTPTLNVGVPWPDPRFTESGACVTDNLTGLMWVKDANFSGLKTWANALISIKDLTMCRYSDWRMPNSKELFSLVDRSQSNPALPTLHPFTNVQSGIDDLYWSSTSYAFDPTGAWTIDMLLGGLIPLLKTEQAFVWPVRSSDAKPLKLVVKKKGNGRGIISGRGLSCASGICAGRYSVGEVIAVTAEASPGSVFDGWSGCGSISDNTCTVTMTTDVTVSATFLKEYKIAVEPTSRKFLNLTKGVASNPKTVTVRNAGAANLIISGIDISGTDAAVFNQVNDCPTELAYNETCTITVTATSNDFAKKIASIAISSNDLDRPTVDVPLKAWAKPPVISVFPNPMDFGGVLLPNTKQKTLKITNAGMNDLEITSPITITGANAGDFFISPDACQPIPAGKNCKLSVSFTPSASGTRTATVNIHSNDPNKPLKTVTLKGKGK